MEGNQTKGSLDHHSLSHFPSSKYKKTKPWIIFFKILICNQQIHSYSHSLSAIFKNSHCANIFMKVYSF